MRAAAAEPPSPGNTDSLPRHTQKRCAPIQPGKGHNASRGAQTRKIRVRKAEQACILLVGVSLQRTAQLHAALSTLREAYVSSASTTPGLPRRGRASDAREKLLQGFFGGPASTEPLGQVFELMTPSFRDQTPVQTQTYTQTHTHNTSVSNGIMLHDAQSPFRMKPWVLFPRLPLES